MTRENQNAVVVNSAPVPIRNNTPEGFPQHGKILNGRKMYYYDVTIRFDDGEEVFGLAQSTAPHKYIHQNGAQVIATVKESQYGNYLQLKKRITNQPQMKAGGSSYNDPVNNLRMAKSIAMTIAIKTFQSLGKHADSDMDIVTDSGKKIDALNALESLAKLYYRWITAEGTIKERDILSRRWYALQDAMEVIKIFNLTKTTEIISYAEHFFAFATGDDNDS